MDGRENWSQVRTVFLDRDGVLNVKAPEGEYVYRLKDFQLLDGVIDAIARLNQAGLRTIVVTNQRGIGLGLYSIADVEAIHANLKHLLARRGARIDGFYICPHDRGQCRCRKPLPGLFEQAAADFEDILAPDSVMIGDSLVDIEFGRRLGMKTIQVLGAADTRAPGIEQAEQMADFSANSLAQAVDQMLGRMGKKGERAPPG
jgi:D-glycero-D-manno-heptose 1,7-bisphosphate phosphatase